MSRIHNGVSYAETPLTLYVGASTALCQHPLNLP